MNYEKVHTPIRYFTSIKKAPLPKRREAIPKTDFISATIKNN